MEPSTMEAHGGSNNEMLNKLGKRIVDVIRRMAGRDPGPPGDPYASVRVPVRRGPPGLAASVALEEPGRPPKRR